MDKVRRIVHQKLIPFHFQRKTVYLSDANYPTENSSQCAQVSVNTANFNNLKYKKNIYLPYFFLISSCFFCRSSRLREKIVNHYAVTFDINNHSNFLHLFLVQLRLLGNCPPTPPLIQHFAVSEK